jgi:hypothetical protein
VPAAANRYEQLLLAPKLHGRHHIRHVGALRNQPRPPVDHPVVNFPRLFVAGIARFDQLPSQTGPESRNRRVIQHSARLNLSKVSWISLRPLHPNATVPSHTMNTTPVRSDQTSCLKGIV